jgi:hypothetical protein
VSEKRCILVPADVPLCRFHDAPPPFIFLPPRLRWHVLLHLLSYCAHLPLRDDAELMLRRRLYLLDTT